VKLRRLAFNAVPVLVVGYVTLGMVADGMPSAQPVTDGIAVGLIVATALALFARRTAPLTILIVSVAGTIPLMAWGYALDYPFIPLVSLYSFAEIGRQSRSRWTVASVACGVLVAAEAWMWVGAGPRTAATRAALWMVGCLLAWLIGDRVRSQREGVTALTTRAERAERERRLAVAEERARIARELHDSTAHTLNAIAMQAGAARLLFDREPATASAAIQSIEDAARQSIGEIDGFLRTLRNGDGLPAELGDLDAIVRGHRAAGLDVSVDIEGEVRGLPRALDWAVARIVGEALTNAARHGDGTATLQVRSTTDAVDVVVTNPLGAAPAASWGGGHGLVGMRERATLLGGELDTANVDGMFRLRARLPRERA
jgi:signal transduction histidine kinase